MNENSSHCNLIHGIRMAREARKFHSQFHSFESIEKLLKFFY